VTGNLARNLQQRERTHAQRYRLALHRVPEGATVTAYSTRHWRVRERRGPAKLLKCVHCAASGTDKQARDWACLHDRDGEDPQDYIPLCRKCHNAYDPTMGHHTPHTEETKALLGEKNRTYKHTPEAVEKIRAAGRNPSPAARAALEAGSRKSAEVRRGRPGLPVSEQARENIRAAALRRRQREREEREAAEGAES
jgi:hypothetical protein